MKKSHVYFVLVMLLAALLSSCASTYYQVYETRPLPGTQVERGDGVLVYEDENCRVLYDFWTDGGNAGFAIYNKTGENLYVDKSESFFVKNGTAKNYYEGKSYARTVNEVVPPPREAVEAAATVDAVVNAVVDQLAQAGFIYPLLFVHWGDDGGDYPYDPLAHTNNLPF